MPPCTPLYPLCLPVPPAQVVTVSGHGSLVNPLSRNAVDKFLPWAARAPAQPCICANTTAGSATGPGDEGTGSV